MVLFAFRRRPDLRRRDQRRQADSTTSPTHGPQPPPCRTSRRPPCRPLLVRLELRRLSAPLRGHSPASFSRSRSVVSDTPSDFAVVLMPWPRSSIATAGRRSISTRGLPQCLPVARGPIDAGLDAFPDKLPFRLRNGGGDGEHRPAHRRRGSPASRRSPRRGCGAPPARPRRRGRGSRPA